MFTIIGGGPGAPGFLTEAALDTLDQAQRILVEPSVRDALAPHPAWLSRAEVAHVEAIAAAFDDFKDDETVWLVPDSPALYPPVRALLESIGPAQWPYCRLVSGVSAAVARLDAEGLLLPEHQWQAVDHNRQVLLQWNGRWAGRARDERLPWSEHRPLASRRVVLLRDGERGQRAIRWLENWGASVMLCPVSRLTDPPSWDPLDRILARLDRFDWAIFSSGEAVNRFFDRLRRLGLDVRRLRARIAVVGPETAVRVRERGLVPELMPEMDYSQEGLVEAFQAVPLRGAVVLFPGGQKNRTFLAEQLRGRGALVEDVVVYQNQPEPLALALHQAIRTESVDAILYTASSQVEYLADQLSHDDRRHLANIPSFSIGPLTSRTLMHYGIRASAEASEPSLRILVDSVRDYYAKENPDVSH